MSVAGSNAYIRRYRQQEPAGNVLNRTTAIACADSPHRTAKRRTKMTSFKILIGAALVSLATISTANAQLPNWAIDNPDLYQSQYPDRDFLNDGALTPAGRIGLEYPRGAAPAFRALNPYAATGHATASHRGSRSADR